MAFKVDIRDYSKGSFKKTKFFNWTPGQHRFRILEEEAPLIQSYWFGNGFIEANGFDDPQATLNRRIKLENPDGFKGVPGFRAIQDRYYLNVLDVSPAKVCPNCEVEVKAENGTFPALCPACGVGVVTEVDAKPLNSVRVLTGGKTLFEQFPTTEAKFVDENDEPISIMTYDCILHVVGKGNQRTSVVLADVGEDGQLKPYEVEVPPEELYDLTSIVPKLTDVEMEKRMAGVSLRDIFAGRKAESSEDEETEATTADPEVVKEQVDTLFEA